MKYIIVEQTGSVYWLEDDILCFTPLCIDGTFDTDDGGEVDEGLIGSEPLPEPYYSDTTFAQLYKRVKWILKGGVER